MSCDISPRQGMSQTYLLSTIKTGRKGGHLFRSKVKPTRYEQKSVLIGYLDAGIFQRAKIDSPSGSVVIQVENSMGREA